MAEYQCMCAEGMPERCPCNTMHGKLSGTPAEMDRQLIIAQEVFAGRLVPTDEAAMGRAIDAVNRAHESKIDATWRELLTVAFRAAGETL